MRRLSTGGLIDRSRSLAFTWDDRRLSAFAGDTLASGLLANGIAVIGRSVSQGRPRGITSAGAEEATGFAQIGVGGSSEPLLRITGVELFDGLVAASRVTKGAWPVGEDTGRFEKRFAHCDVLVIGGGPAGLQAARDAGATGNRVILATRGSVLGGRLLDAPTHPIDGVDAATWVSSMTAALRRQAGLRVLTRTTASLSLDQNGMLLVERVAERFAPKDRGEAPERILWQVRANQIVLATGALERPIVFGNNDRPGIMLAGALRRYLHRHAVVPERAVIFTNNDSGYSVAVDLAAALVPVTVIDPRQEATGPGAGRATAQGLTIHRGSAVVGTTAAPDGRLDGVLVQTTDRGTIQFPCEVLGVSGGWDPALDLHHQLRGPVAWHETIHATVPTEPLPGWTIVGAAAGDGLPGSSAHPDRPAPLWYVPAPDGNESWSFVDLHRDVTVAGVARGIHAGIRHPEHLKRYTLIGTGVEQGRTAKSVAAGVATALLDTAGPWGTSSARPPAEPIAFATMAGRFRGALFEPIRTTPIHAAHQALGAVFENVGQWIRPRYYPRPGESMANAVARECRAVRNAVGIMDASTLGKIDVQGRDAARFLDRLYCNHVDTLRVGRARYSAMCRLDGMLFDDGVVMRLGPERFFVTTSTSHAASVMGWMEEWLQTEWPDLEVWLTSITEQWATVALAGPRARAVLAQVTSGLDLSQERFPFLAVGHGTVAGFDAQVARVSFSGELAFEISVAGHQGQALWEALLAAGAAQGITPYGLEALGVLRAEKGFIIVGVDTDATTTPFDAGLGWLVAKDKDFLGKRSLKRPDMQKTDRKRLVGILPEDGSVWVPEGAQLVADPGEPRPMTMLGHVTSSYHSEALGRTFGLAMLRGGLDRIGQRLFAPLEGGTISVQVVDPVFYDKAGARRNG